MRGDDRARGGVSAIFHSQVCGTAVNNNSNQPAPTLVGIIVIIGRFTRRRAPRASRPSRPPFAMRAAVYDRTAVEGVRVVTRPPPTAPARDALLVRVRACGVNPVDAKGVVGDKLPAFLRPLARRALDGTDVETAAPSGQAMRLVLSGVPDGSRSRWMSAAGTVLELETAGS